jgi:protein TonB
MYSETRDTRTPDLRASGAVSLAVHGALILLIGVAVTHSRARFRPPTLQTIRLDVDLPTPVAAASTLASPSASPVEAAVPQVAAPPRPAMLAAQNEERLALSAAPQDVAPATPDSVAPLASEAGGVTTFVATETTAKRIFGTGAADDALGGLGFPAGHPAAAGRNGNGAGIEGPISLRRDIKPRYPLGARQRGEEGTVVLETSVAPDGRASAVAVVSSSRFAELDRAAVKAVEQAAFNPATEDGRIVEAQARITIIFRLTN